MSEQRSEDRVAKLADAITSHIFSIGLEKGERPHRMEYKIKRMSLPAGEFGAGGLCESAMRRYVEEAIRSFEASNG